MSDICFTSHASAHGPWDSDDMGMTASGYVFALVHALGKVRSCVLSALNWKYQRQERDTVFGFGYKLEWSVQALEVDCHWSTTAAATSANHLVRVISQLPAKT